MRKRPMIKLGKYVISEDSPFFVIAELGYNHLEWRDLRKKTVTKFEEPSIGVVHDEG